MNFYETYILPHILSISGKVFASNNDRRSIAAQASGVVLEIGIGSGPNIPFYKEIKKLYALEPSQQAFSLAKKRVELAPFAIEYLNSSAENIPLPDNSIDTVVSTWTLCSISRPDVALREMARVLKPGGKFVFVEHGKSSRQFIAKLQQFLTPVTTCIAGGCHLDRNIEQLINQNSFRITLLEKKQRYPRVFAFTYLGTATPQK